jgi:gluconate 2-dehydrogenase subunit 3-like protein
MIERRDLFKIVTMGALAAPAAAQTHDHTAAARGKAAATHPPFFNDAQRAMVDRLADIIIPPDEQSPGAHDAGVVRFIDLLAGASAQPRQQQWIHGLDAVDKAARARFSKPFAQCERAQQERIVAAMAENEGDPQNDLQRFFLLIKHATVDGYRFSEIGIKQYMGWVGNQFETKRWSGACNHPEHGAKA